MRQFAKLLAQVTLCLVSSLLGLALVGPELVHQLVSLGLPDVPPPPRFRFDDRVATVLWIAEEPGCTPRKTVLHPHTYVPVGLNSAANHEQVPGLGLATWISGDLRRSLKADHGRFPWRLLRAISFEISLTRQWSPRDLLAYWAESGRFTGGRGVEAGAARLFGQPVSDLQIGQLALLAGLPRSPSLYDPLVHPERALERRNRVLQQLAVCDVISVDQLVSLSEAPLDLRAEPPK